MSTRQFKHNCLGVDLFFEGPDSAEEVGKLTGNSDACLEAYMAQWAFHVRNPAIREINARKVEEYTGQKPQHNKKGKTITKKNPDGVGTFEEPAMETDAEFTSRLIAEGKLSEVDHNRLVEEAAQEAGDYVAPTPGRDGKPNAKCYKEADSLLAAIEAGRGTAERYMEKWTARNGRPFPGATANRDTVAKAFQIEYARLEAEAKSSLLD